MQNENIPPIRNSKKGLKILIVFVIIIFTAIASLTGTYFYLTNRSNGGYNGKSISNKQSNSDPSKKDEKNTTKGCKEIETELNKINSSINGFVNLLNTKSFKRLDKYDNGSELNKTVEENGSVLELIREIFERTQYNSILQIQPDNVNKDENIKNVINVDMPIKFSTNQYIDFMIYQRNNLNDKNILKKEEVEKKAEVVIQLEKEIKMRQTIFLLFIEKLMYTYLGENFIDEILETKSKIIISNDDNEQEFKDFMKSIKENNIEDLISKDNEAYFKLAINYQNLYFQNLCKVSKNIFTMGNDQNGTKNISKKSIEEIFKFSWKLNLDKKYIDNNSFKMIITLIENNCEDYKKMESVFMENYKKYESKTASDDTESLLTTSNIKSINKIRRKNSTPNILKPELKPFNDNSSEIKNKDSNIKKISADEIFWTYVTTKLVENMKNKTFSEKYINELIIFEDLVIMIDYYKQMKMLIEILEEYNKRIGTNTEYKNEY